jgi:hypothetical protein
MPQSKNASLLRRLVSDADSWATRAAKFSFPVLLRPLAEVRRVTSVEFRPLLVDAMLTTHPNGFRILFNSDGDASAGLQQRYKDESPERMMPSRLRFSLAHELAHTFFYDLSEPAPRIAKEFASGGGRTALENLELYCNKLASHLLLPTAMVRAEFLRMKVIDPNSILRLSKRAGVSVEALVRRLGDENSLFVQRYFKGSIVLVDQKSDGTQIRAIAKPTVWNIARGLQVMRVGEPWRLTTHSGTEISLGDLASISTAILKIETQRTMSEKRYNVAAAEIPGYSSTKTHLITFAESDG